MSKKRKCRYTDDEMAVHTQAVRIRKMTDAQLAEYIRKTEELARKGGITEGMSLAREKVPAVDIDSLAEEIAGLKGVGEVKMKYIREILEKRLGGEA
ncbi:MAG: hypothetical protein LUD72_10085 [Bacteroidales bacterium]|nr:hypothetical protein [Bacteroidales bacterium]